MTFYNTLFLSAIVHPLDEIIQELVRHITDAELPHSTPVGANNLSDILDAIEDDMAVNVLAIYVSSVIQMIDGSRCARDLWFGLFIKLFVSGNQSRLKVGGWKLDTQPRGRRQRISASCNSI
jgi:hypothetical protein